jgi:hypothetical protein
LWRTEDFANGNWWLRYPKFSPYTSSSAPCKLLGWAYSVRLSMCISFVDQGWWGFVLSYEASVVLMHWKRTATESCICCVLMCITKLVKSRQSTPRCNENICNAHLVAFFTGWNQGWLGGATHMPC